MVVPLISGVGGYFGSDATTGLKGFYQIEQVGPLLALTLFGVGNAMIMGMAVGDLGRTLAAVVVAAAAALVSVEILGEFAIYVGAIPVVAAWSACFSLDFTSERISGAIVAGLVGLATGVAMGIVVSIPFYLIAVLVVFRMPGPYTEIFLALAAPGALCANVIFIGRLFRYTFRVASEQTSNAVQVDDAEEA